MYVKEIFKSEDGFTILELLTALVLTSFMSIFLMQITTQATKSVTAIGESAVTVQSAIRFSNIIKYDFSGSQDVYIHSNTQPVQNNNKSCTTFLSGKSIWSSPTGVLPYVRGLFTLRIAEVNYSRTSEVSPKWQQLIPTWIGYEIRQRTYQSGKEVVPNFELWRVFCDDKSGAPSTPNDLKSEKLIILGNVLSTSVLTDLYMKCFDDISSTTGIVTTNPVECRSGISPGYDGPTASRTDYYKFELPYKGSKFILNTLKQDELQQLRRRIDN